MKLKRIKATASQAFANLFRLPAVLLAIACLVMVHLVYYLTTECGRSAFAGTKYLVSKNSPKLKSRSEFIIQAVHDYGRELALVLWVYSLLQITFKFI
jgi:hypothetical protein